jgi:hypothetical protein
VAGAVTQSRLRPLALAGAGEPAHLQLHQPLGGKADDLAQQVGVGGLLHEGAKLIISSVIDRFLGPG